MIIWCTRTIVVPYTTVWYFITIPYTLVTTRSAEVSSIYELPYQSSHEGERVSDELCEMSA